MDETQTAPAVQTNKPLANIVIDEVQRQTTDDAVRGIVAKNVEALIKQTVESALRSYGDIGKQIQKQVGAALEVGDLTIPSYSHMVSAVVQAKVEEHMDATINERLKIELDEILGIGAGEVKLSEIVQEMVTRLEGESDRFGSYVTCDVGETEYGSRWVRLDEGEDVKRHSCEVRALVRDDGKIGALFLDGVDMEKSARLGSWKDHHRTLFALYCRGGKLIVDEDSVVTAIGDF
ncbi:hypothetical protein [Fodinicurvata sp. EGI_FJ10296]|uniref:hypothetical protein n=1 Tax=Fodinicurvata sp. EGI_FJ10296 TaxID=3231908 RepID=UPI003451B184